ncbi:S-adenosyl-L-methionine-dependent methyltransferase [Exidia glandulosa HHB12029]|uniref:S-adenosyl-L-methionine-dependent methyltransferase n=1 Tax=Exidia glandulosa HHB12029 TaxID=1314781 RepID=A0A165GK72_EXIGL|nr:S-adenosyl-L-methionine-dependent methyltransferase [Exidia glandulosa HHB12029]
MAPALSRLQALLQDIEHSVLFLRDALRVEPDGAELQQRVAAELGLPFHSTIEFAQEAARLRNAADELIQLVTPPRHLVFEAAGSFYTTIALHTAMQSDIATFIAAQGGAGVSIRDFAQEADIDGEYFERLVRHLTTYGIFIETSPGVFANSAQSMTMANKPEFCAHLDIVMREGTMVAPHWPRFLEQRALGRQSGSPLLPSPFSLVSNGVPFYEWLHSASAGVRRGDTFNLAMRGMSVTEGLAFLPADYPFAELRSDTLIVDVGGGVGSVPSLVLPHAPHLRFLVQDVGPVISQALVLAAPGTRMRRWIVEGRVKFQVQDCFRSQPPETDGAIFLLKNMLHNYADEQAERLLHVIRAANPAKLLLIDRVLFPATAASVSSTAPSGVVTSQRATTIYDLIMGGLHGARVRTLAEWTSLLVRTHFKLENVWQLRASTGQYVLEAAIV